MIPSGTAENQETTFAITAAKLFVLVLTLSTDNNAKLLQQLQPGFKRTIHWKRYRRRVTMQVQNSYSDHLISPNVREVNGLCNLSKNRN